MKNDTLKMLIEKYRLANPLREKTKNNITSSRKKNLISILKKKKRYSLFVFLTISVMFCFKRIGITLSLIQSAIIVTITAILSTAILTTATAYSVKYFFPKKTATSIDTIEEVEQKIERKKKSKKQKAAGKYLIGMIPFEYSSAIAHIGTKVNDSLYTELKALKGSRAILYGKGTNNNIKSDVRIVGSVVKLGKGYFITAKIINLKNSRVLYHTTENAISADDIEQACAMLAKRLIKKM